MPRAYDFHLTDSAPADDHVTDEMILVCLDHKQLGEWFTGMNELYTRLRDEVDERRFTGTADRDWLERVGGKLGWLRFGMRKVEARMIELGFPVPYPPTDPRLREIRNLSKAVERLKALLREHGINPQRGEPV